MEAYKRAAGRMFPTFSEALGVAVSLGYRKPEQIVPVKTEPPERPGPDHSFNGAIERALNRRGRRR